MAIIIPSKNIYSMDRSIVAKNLIDGVTVKGYTPNLQKNIDVPVYDTNQIIDDYTNTVAVNKDFQKKLLSSSGSMLYSFSLIRDYVGHTSMPTIEVSKDQKLKRIIKLGRGNENEIFSITLSGIKKTTPMTAVVFYNPSIDMNSQPWGDVSYGETIEEEVNIQFPDTPITLHNEYSDGGSKITSDAKGQTIPCNAHTLIFEEDKDWFAFRFDALYGRYVIEQLTYGGYTVGDLVENKKLSGERVEYIATKVSITFYGETLELVLSDFSTKFPTTANNLLSVERNELMQSSNYIEDEDNDWYDVLFSPTISQYINGKETATLKCSISDYYDYETKELIISSTSPMPNLSEIILDLDGYQVEINKSLPYDLYVELEFSSATWGIYTEETVIQKGLTYTERFAADDESIISAKIIGIGKDELPMTFEVSNSVIPMVFGADGQDHPMSLHQDGSPKVFQVVGTKIFYDGAVWQELSLQEV